MKLSVGTKSVLFGVHAFWFHPITVALAFRRVHRRWPNWWEAIGIACHDLGYWGRTDMDGLSGTFHPPEGALLAADFVGVFSADRAVDVYYFCVYHSSTYAGLHAEKPSALYLPDKVSILMEPKWWYLFRARLSGELTEYMERESKKLGLSLLTPNVWYARYRKSVQNKLNTHDLCQNKKTQIVSTPSPFSGFFL